VIVRITTHRKECRLCWLHDLLKPHVAHLLVNGPRKSVLLKDGSKSDRIDARKLAVLLRGNQLKLVYHADQGLRTLKELSRSYLTITKDLTRVMSRIKALYRGWAIPCSGIRGRRLQSVTEISLGGQRSDAGGIGVGALQRSRRWKSLQKSYPSGGRKQRLLTLRSFALEKCSFLIRPCRVAWTRSGDYE
jgi:hypothetical protein